MWTLPPPHHLPTRRRRAAQRSGSAACGRPRHFRLTRERVRRPVHARDLAVRVADELERLASLAPEDGAEAVALDALEARPRHPARRAGPPRLESPVVPAEDELRSLRPPAAECARDIVG